MRRARFRGELTARSRAATPELRRIAVEKHRVLTGFRHPESIVRERVRREVAERHHLSGLAEPLAQPGQRTVLRVVHFNPAKAVAIEVALPQRRLRTVQMVGAAHQMQQARHGEASPAAAIRAGAFRSIRATPRFPAP